ncbi:MAG: DNA gyrase inhibitor YacG [Methylococcaceae bacterium]|nr:DNA gyrase inhibitor YacG [Methylococcaceae bacterium]
MALKVSCPICAAKVEWIAEQRFKPFCSERCKMIDLGDWATEAHKIPCESSDVEVSDDELF